MNRKNSLLSDYFDVVEENRLAKYIKSKYVSVSFKKSDSEKVLWEKHDEALKKMKTNEKIPGRSLIDLKIELASRIFEKCHFCERKCNVDRNKKAGNCGVKQPQVSSEFLHMGEESVLVPSYTVFFSGCTFHCVFCQNWDISQRSCGVYVEPSVVASWIDKRKSQGARNVNWVGGDPTPNLTFILEVLKECSVNVPQIWNSNMYCSVETMKLLDGIIDLFLTDFKYGNDECARRLSKVEKYSKIIKRNHVFAYDQGDMIIRHLVMPGHVECCSKPVMDWISSNFPEVMVNIMAQYRPEYHAYDYDEISKRVSMDEVLIVRDYAKKLGINEM